MKLLPRVPLLLLLAACAPAPSIPTITATPPPPTAVAAAPAPPTPLAPVDPSLPAGSAGLVSLDVAQIDAIAGAALRRMPAADRAESERALHLATGAFADGQIARALGLDPARPIVASVGLAGAAAVARERLLPLVGTKATAAALRRSFEGTSGLAITIRAVFPTATDGAALEAALAALFALDRWTTATPPAGFEALYVERNGHAAAGVSRTAGAVVVDVAMPAGAPRGKAARDAAIEALRAVRARAPGGPHDAPLPLDGHPARVRYAPSAFADIGLITGVSAVLGALTHASVDDGVRDELAEAGLAEAARSSQLAGAGGRAYFDSIDLTLDGGFGSLGFTARAELGPGGDLPAAAWARGPAIAIPGAYAIMDIALPWARAWSSFEPDPLAERDVQHAVREAGWTGAVAGLPLLFAAEIWDPMRRIAKRPALFQHLDRITIFTAGHSQPDSYVALLAPGVRPADVACALVEQGEPCEPAARLRPGATAKAGNRHARLVQVKGRWAIVLSKDKGAVEKSKLDLAPAAAARLELPGGPELAREVDPLPAAMFADGYICEATLEGRTAVVRVRAAPTPAKRR